VVQKVNSPQTYGGQIGDRHRFLLGLGNSKRDSVECASLLSENAKVRTTRLAGGISKVSLFSRREEQSQLEGLSLFVL